jgi:hypothetical protein
LSRRDADPAAAMVDKFAATFAALREALASGQPITLDYDGMRAANDARDEFMQLHAGHGVDEIWVGKSIVTRCHDCDVEFREFYGL